ncbi:MAG: STAS domain-containing protein [Ardenticatenales bacterium]|nr:STAS domain-containing protein [Ardenticatenales bacterium]
MNLEHEELKRVDIFRASGRIDSSNAQQFEDALTEKIKKDGRGNLVVNLKDVEYMSSAAIRALIAALKETRGKMLGAGNVVLVEVPPHIREVFDLAAITSLFTFYDTEAQAVGSF